jgi:DNA invertase Pin-like site-specific DNA recombinase
MRVGYIKQTKKQSSELQSQILISNKCEKLYHELNSCSNIYSRDVLDKLTEELSSDNTIVVTRIVVCANSIKELYELLQQLKSKQINFEVVEQELSVTEELMSQLKVLAEFEENVHYQRQTDGIAKAQSRGVKFGRKPKLNIDGVIQAMELKEQGYSNQQIANKFSMGKSTLLRYFAERRAS